jgi:hypothetical protein
MAWRPVTQIAKGNDLTSRFIQVSFYWNAKINFVTPRIESRSDRQSGRDLTRRWGVIKRRFHA